MNPTIRFRHADPDRETSANHVTIAGGCRAARSVPILLAMLGAMTVAGAIPCVGAEARHAVGSTPSERVTATAINLDLRTLQTESSHQLGVGSESTLKGAHPETTTLRESRTEVPDPLVAAQQVAANKAASVWTVDLNISGIGFTTATPADPTGEIGAGYFVQMVNGPQGSLVAVFDSTTGAVIAGPSRLEDLWQGAGSCAEGWGHPGVVYDSLAQRWILSEIGAGNHLCVYVSQTADPVTGGWYGYDFALPGFPDFARIGVWPDLYSVSANEDLPAVYALERAAMLGGSPAGWQRFTAPSLDGFGFQALTPVDFDGTTLPGAGTGALFIRHVDGGLHGGGDRLELFELDVDWGSPQNTSFSGPVGISTASFDSRLCGTAGRACVPQPGTSITLDPLREVVSGLARYRRFPTHESLMGNFAVDTNASDRAGIRWFELRRNGGSWTLHQEGTYSPDSLHRWIGGLAMDRDGNVALAFNSSHAASTYPSIRATGRAAADPAGVMTVVELELQAGSSPQTHGLSPELWGSSASVSVSPADDCTFWTTAAYAENGGWNTRIASFRAPSCDTAGSDLIFADGFESGTTGGWSTALP